MPRVYTLSYLDVSSEKSAFQTRVNDASSALQIGALKDAVQAISLGTLTTTTDSTVVQGTNVPPTNTLARREQAVGLVFQDTANFRIGRVSIPCANYSSLTRIPGTDNFVLADAGLMAAMVTAFEAIARSVDGNPVTVLRAVDLGRNN